MSLSICLNSTAEEMQKVGMELCKFDIVSLFNLENGRFTLKILSITL